MNHIVDTCPLTKFECGLNLLHEADDDDCSTREKNKRESKYTFNDTAYFSRILPGLRDPTSRLVSRDTHVSTYIRELLSYKRSQHK